VSAKFNLGTARQWWPVAALYSVSAIFDETELTRVNDQAICRVLEAAARRDAAPPEIDHHRKDFGRSVRMPFRISRTRDKRRLSMDA
jgi:hypothetical protein